MMVNNGENSRIPPARDKLLRENYDERHNLFEACFIIGRDFIVFFDYECTNCYVAELLARILPAYNSRKPAIITGVKEFGPSVLHDAIVTGRFLTSESKSKFFAVTCGVVPDGIFSGDITFGKSVFHKWEFISYISGKRIEAVRFNRFIKQLKLIPKQIRVNRDNENPAFAITENANPSGVRWGAAIPLKPRIRAFLLDYVTRFPGFFDPKARRTDVLSKTEHSIDTGDAKPVKLPSRRYSL
jgi:hypothetical protein